MNFDDLMLDPIYDTLGVDVTVFAPEEPGTDTGTDPAPLPVFVGRVIDKTAGVEVEGATGRGRNDGRGGVGMHTVVPVMAVKAKDLAAQGLDPEDLLKCEVALNGTTWVIQNHLPRPGIYGEPGGQVYFQMRKRRDG